MRGVESSSRRGTCGARNHPATGRLLVHPPRGIRLLVLLSALLLRPCASDWIDPDTPKPERTITSLVMDADGKSFLVPSPVNGNITVVDKTRLAASPPTKKKTYHLVMSDEFNAPGRTFHDGHDPKWTALDRNDYTNDALHYYSQDNARTNANGELEIISEVGDTDVVGFDDATLKKKRVTKHFRSGMVQGWNKFCFTGGIVEAEVILPGWHDVGGLWPAFWLLGNLARHVYVASSAHIWPFSAHGCSAMTEESQLINGCHEAEHYGLERGFGRGAPEIDIFEVQPGSDKAYERGFKISNVGQPFMSASYQVAPGKPGRPPSGGYLFPREDQWYTNMTQGNDTCLNIYFYGNFNFFPDDVTPRNDYWSDAISYNRQLYESHFVERHKYRLEWGVPKGVNATGFDSGYLSWFLDGELVWSMNGTTMNEAKLGTEISSEPMSILFNTAISKQWGFPKANWCPSGCPCKKYNCRSDKEEETCGFNPGFCEMMKLRPTMKVNYVRVYQDADDEAQKVGCSTPERPTRRYIEANAKSYMKEGDTQMLKKIQKGQGRCDSSISLSDVNTCGGPTKGRCTPGQVCECEEGWTGPNCLVPDGHDPIAYDPPDTIGDIGFGAPFVPTFLWVTLVALVGMVIFNVAIQPRWKGWKWIPDVDLA